jgi:hypothetical protein
MSGFLSNSDKEGLKNKFQVIATGSHPLVIYLFGLYRRLGPTGKCVYRKVALQPPPLTHRVEEREMIQVLGFIVNIQYSVLKRPRATHWQLPSSYSSA